MTILILSDLLMVLHPAVKKMAPNIILDFVSDIKKIIVEEKLATLDHSTGQITATHQIFRIIAKKQKYK